MRLLTLEELTRRFEECKYKFAIPCWFCKHREAAKVCFDCTYGCCDKCSRFGDCPLCEEVD